jgi:RHS repeat-associated protein
VLAATGTPGGGTGGSLALTDTHGNQAGQFTASGTSLSGSRAYDPWGNTAATTGAMTGLLGYQSAWSDAASGKDLMGARWYDPAAGDFISADTIQVSPVPDPAAGNPFAYAADAPLDFTDPTGHFISAGGPGTVNVNYTHLQTDQTYANVYTNDVYNGRSARAQRDASIAVADQEAQKAAARAADKAAAERAARARAAKIAAQKAAAQKAAARAKEQAAAKARARAAAQKAAAKRAAQQAAVTASANCDGPMMFKLGACPSERGAAGTTPGQVKASFIGAAIVIAVSIAGPIIGAGAGLFGAAEDAGGTTQLFRAVGSAEARDIAGSGVYRNPEGLEGKYFYPTRAQAENLGAKYAKLGLGEQSLTSGQISTALLRGAGEPIEPAGEGPAFFLRNEYLQYINDVTIEGPVP